MGIEIGPLYVRRSCFIQQAPERVWQEFVSFEKVTAWLGRGHRLEVYEPGLGGAVRFSVEIEGKRRFFGGSIVVFDAARELTYSNDWEVDGWPVPTLITLRLTPLYAGCLVELFHHGFERLGAEAGAELEGYGAGWSVQHLTALRSIVEA